MAAPQPLPAQVPQPIPPALPSVPQQQYASASLYVGDLLPNVGESALFDLFNQVGPVASIRVCRDAVSRRSLGYAYVNFHSAVDAERALDTLNFTPILNRPCRIMWCQRDPTLRKSNVGNIFIKNLDPQIDNKALFDSFSVFGNILSCKVATDPNTGASLGYGFVHYESEEAAKKAIAAVDGKKIGDYPPIVKVSPFRPKSERGAADKNKFTNVFVKNLPADMDEAKLVEMFSKYGEITSRFLAHDDQGKSRCFGFANFRTCEEAQAAVNGLNDTMVGDKKIFVGRAQKKAERMKELRERYERERQKKYAGVNVYVKNLDDSVDDAMLVQEFSKFGHITSAKVMRDPKTNRSRGFGFVCYTTPEEASKAFTEMNNHILNGKPLYAALAQRKEERRMQLSQQINRMRLVAAQAQMQPALYPPVFYPGPNPRQYMFPQAMLPAGGRGRWPQMPGVAPQMMQMPGMASMPFMLRPGPGIPRRGGAAAGAGGRGGVPPFKYTNAARNREQMPAAPMGMPAQPQPQQNQIQVIVQEISRAPEKGKQILGEALYPMVFRQNQPLAAKITGMLLDLDNTELIHLLEAPKALADKVEEAMRVLQEHEQAQQQPAPAQAPGTTAPAAVPAEAPAPANQ